MEEGGQAGLGLRSVTRTGFRQERKEGWALLHVNEGSVSFLKRGETEALKKGETEKVCAWEM